MDGILAGFAAIWAVTAAGWLVDRLDLLGGRAERSLARLTFLVLPPAPLRPCPGRTRRGCSPRRWRPSP